MRSSIGSLVRPLASSFPVAVIRQTYSIGKRAPKRCSMSTMRWLLELMTVVYGEATMPDRRLILLALPIFFLTVQDALAVPHPQEPQGEVIGTIEGQAISLKGPMSVQVVGNEVKTLLRSGVDIRVKLGRARINLVEGGTIALCGPAHISMLKAGKALTVALDSGTIHAHVEGNLTLNVFTAQILAKTVAIGDGPLDVLVGFDTPALMCIRTARGALRLEEQFGGQTVMVPQGGDVTIANGQLQGMQSNSGLCACESLDTGTTASDLNVPEVSRLASRDEIKRDAVPRKPVAQPVANPAAPELPKPVDREPAYQVFMPPLRYDAAAKVQDEPDPKLIVLVRRIRVRPTLIFQSRVEGDAMPPPTLLNAAKIKPEQPATKPAAPASNSVVDRVKTFFKSLWTPSS